MSTSKPMRTFGELAKSRKAPTIEIVALPKIFVTPNELQEGTTALQLAAENLRRKKVAQAKAETILLESVLAFTTWMQDMGLRHIADIDAFVQELGEEYLMEDYDGVREEEAPNEGEKKTFTIGDRRKEVRGKIDKYLNCGDPRVALPLEATEVAFWLSSKPFTRQELGAKMRQLEKDDVVARNFNGDIHVLGENYSFHQRWNVLKEPQQTEVKAKIKDAIHAQAARIEKEKEDAELAKAAQVSAKIKEFMAPDASDLPVLDAMDETKTGKCAALVNGGAVWFQVNEHSMDLLDVAGTPENGFANLVAIEEKYPGNKIRVKRSSLKNKEGGLAKAKPAPGVEVPAEISRSSDDYDKWIAAGKFAWYTIRGAIERAMESRRKASQGLFHEEFHDQGELGKYRPNMRGFVFKVFGPGKQIQQETPLDDLGLEVERFAPVLGKDPMIRVTEYNPDFAEFMETHGCNNRNFREGDRFEGCPPVIRLILQRDYGMMPGKAAIPARSNGQHTNGKKPEAPSAAQETKAEAEQTAETQAKQ